MPQARTRKQKAPPADMGDVATDLVDDAAAAAMHAAPAAEIVGPPAPLPQAPELPRPGPAPRPALISSRLAARALRTDDWIEVRCLVGNVHTSVGKMLSGQTEFLPPEEVALLDKLDRIKRV